MRIVKLVLINVIFFAFVVTIISLFIPSHFRISRTERISALANEVMAQLNDPVKWRSWYPNGDSSEFFYEAGEIKGIILNEKQKQYLLIDSVKQNEVLTHYNNSSGRKILSDWRIVPETDSNRVTIQWYMDFNLRWYPWEKFSSLLFDKSYGTQMEMGLKQLKRLLESK